MSRSRAWCFTLNNPSDDDKSAVSKFSTKCEYFICGLEHGESGTEHLQGYFYKKSAVMFSTLHKAFPRAHFEVAKGSPSDNKKYCSKESVFLESGFIPRQGKRTDLDIVKEKVIAGESMTSVILECASYNSVKMADSMYKYLERKRNFKPKVYWFWGPTGSGKTKTAMEFGDDPYFCMCTSKWWEGYDAHKVVIIDDMRKDFCKFHDFLRMIDRYPYRVETKGGSRQLLAEIMVITSCYSPEDLFSTREDLAQLLRRIDEVREFKL